MEERSWIKWDQWREKLRVRNGTTSLFMRCGMESCVGTGKKKRKKNPLQFKEGATRTPTVSAFILHPPRGDLLSSFHTTTGVFFVFVCFFYKNEPSVMKIAGHSLGNGCLDPPLPYLSLRVVTAT